MHKGDSIIQIMRTGNSRYVEEVARLVGMRRAKSPRRKTVATYLFLECHRRPKRVPWIEFKQRCAAIGLNFGMRLGTRELTNTAQAAKVLAFVSRKQQI